MGAVQDHLVAGVGMNGGHDAADDRILVIQSLGHGSQAVGGAGSSGDDLVFLGQGLLVHGENDGGQILAGGGGDNDLLSASLQVSFALFLAGVEAGALQNDVHVQLAPGAVGGVLLGVDLDFLAVHDDGVLGGLNGVQVFADVAAVGTLSGIILQQVGQHSGAGQVVDSDHFIALSAEHLTESQTADTSKTVNRNFNHYVVPP